MKDLFVLTADADTLAVFESLLDRPSALGIRPVQFAVDRHPFRDPGMIKDGPELIRRQVWKEEFRKVLLVWDHEGSGCERRKRPEQAQREIQDRLDGFTWQDRSGAVVIVPELEEWLWRDRKTLLAYLGLTAAQLQSLAAKLVTRKIPDPAATKPKELLEVACHRTGRGRLLPDDFRQVAAKANLSSWQSSSSFQSVMKMLREWFPAG